MFLFLEERLTVSFTAIIADSRWGENFVQGWDSDRMVVGTRSSQRVGSPDAFLDPLFVGKLDRKVHRRKV